jgi:hypothetical protein
MTTDQQDLTQFLGEFRSRKPADDSPDTTMTALKLGALALAGMLITGWLCNWGQRAPAQEPSPGQQVAQQGDMAAWMAQKLVTQQLRSPSTATFPPSADVTPTARGWRVSSYVDAQNGFGANIRSHWSAELTAQGNEWELVSLDWSNN